MSKITDIQWCDSTINPVMGCVGCELFPKPRNILSDIDATAAETGNTISSKLIFKELVDDAFKDITKPHPGHKQAVNTTNIWHLRKQFAERIRNDNGPEVEKAVSMVIRKSVTCYAAKLHLNKGANILKPDYEPKNGYAPIFEVVTSFKGRMDAAAKWSDLLGQEDSTTPWKSGLPRMIFVSDMGDALSAKRDFPFLEREVIPAFQSDVGGNHLWLWLTKQPENMVELSEKIGGFPENVCAMTTVTNAESEILKRIDELRKVKASIRGLSIEPLWERIPPSLLDLTGIHWMIVGGESGSGDLTRTFALEWAEELRDHCRKHGVAFFLKQLGRNPTRGGQPVKLCDKHGGDWSEWEESLRVREFPIAFHEYRRDKMKSSNKPRPGKKKTEKKKKTESLE